MDTELSSSLDYPVPSPGPRAAAEAAS
jgi:hypothetical protein